MSDSFSFPTMISTKSGAFKGISGKDAVKQNLKLFFKTNKTELLGDPYFGTNLKRLLFEPNDVVLKDILIDEIYSGIRTFFKEITIKRNDIKIKQIKEKVNIEVKYLYNIDGSNDLFNITLVNSGEML